MKKRLLSILLVICLVLPLVPDFLPANAEETTDAFGIRMDDTFDKEAAMADNPYGTDGWQPLLTISELFVAKGHSDGRWWNTYNYNNDENGEPGSIQAATSGASIGSKYEGNDNGFSIVDTAPVDIYGEGQKKYTAVYGYWKDKKKLQVFLTDQSGNRLTEPVEIGPGETLDYLNDAETHNNTGFISVTAGDFDGDGRDSIVLYRPDMEDNSRQPSIIIFDIQEDNGTLELVDGIGNDGANITNVYSMLGVRNIATDNSNDGKVRKNAPVVQLLVEDTDNDNIDELIITAGLNNTSANDISKRQSQMFIYDFEKNVSENPWIQTFCLNTSGYTGGYNGAQRLRWASSSVGNISSSNGATDYPEIITAGWIDKNGSDGDDVTDAIGSYITRCMSTTVNENGTSVGSYQASQIQAIQEDAVSDFTREGHYEGDDVQSLLTVNAFLADGVNERASILIADTVYTFDGQKLEQGYRSEYFNDDDDGIGGNIISNNLVQDSVSADFDGNTDGKEQVIFSVCQKRSGRNDYFYKLYTYQRNSDGTWSCDATDDYIIYQIGNAYVSLCATDVDEDSIIARIKDSSLTYTEPELLAILESTPYFSEIDGGDTGNSETAYGKSEGSGTGTTTSNGLSTSVTAGFEYELDDATLGFSLGFSFEASVENNFTWESSESTSVEYELNYSNDTGDNMVIVYRRPVTTWEYEVKNSDATLTLAKQGTLLTSMISVDSYNEVAPQYDMSPINETLLATPGDPFSYRDSIAGFDKGVMSETSASYNGAGTISQSFSYSSEQEDSFTYEMSTSFSANGKFFGVTAGAGAGYVTTSTSSTINMSGISKSGTVTGNDVDGYDFTWRFAHWTEKIDGQEIPVLGYVLNNVVAPPTPPLDIEVTDVTSNSATLEWEIGSRQADEYRIYQIYQDGNNAQIDVVDGTENTYDLIDLSPNTTYTYAVSAYSEPSGSGRVSGESVLSNEVIVATYPENIASVNITDPTDQTAKPGKNATFFSSISISSDDFNSISYQWQKKQPGENWKNINGATSENLWINNVQTENDGTQYRCMFKVSYRNLSSLVQYYSNPATLTVGKTTVTTTLSVQNSNSLSGAGTFDDPYQGQADYKEKTSETTSVVTVEKNVTIESSDNIPALTVYSDANDANEQYYGIGTDENNNQVYYTLNKSGNSYTVGQKITVINTVEYLDADLSQSVKDVPEDFDGNQITTSKEDETYYLMAAITGTSAVSGAPEGVNSRFNSINVITYYWRNGSTYYTYDAENGSVGDRVLSIEADKLFDVYVMPPKEEEGEEPPQGDGTEEPAVYIFGRNETWTVKDTEEEGSFDDRSEYLYLMVTEESGTYKDITYMTVSSETSYEIAGENLSNFNPASLQNVTTKETQEIKTPIYEMAEGTSLTLQASVQEDNGSVKVEDVSVDFYITNVQTGARSTLSAITGEDGTASVTWRAASAGLYSIRAVSRATADYLQSDSQEVYYDAYSTSADTTTTMEYRLNLFQDIDTPITGSVSYGKQTISMQLQKRENAALENNSPGEWTDATDESIVYTMEKTTSTESQEEILTNGNVDSPDVGTYLFRAYQRPDSMTPEQVVGKNAYLLTSTSLIVNPVAVTIIPTWGKGTTPGSADDITLQEEKGQKIYLQENTSLSNLINISCDYFGKDGNPDVYGIFTVSLSYTKDENYQNALSAFTNNYAVTLKEDTFTVKPGSAQIHFSSGENGSVSGRYGYNQFSLTSGSSKTQGTKLIFQARPEEGYSVDYWSINGTKYIIEGDTDSLEPLSGMAFTDDGKGLQIDSFNLDEHTKDGQLNIYVSFKSTASKIIFNVENSTGGTITAENGTGNALTSGQLVNNGSTIIFTAEPNTNYVIDHWTVNGDTYFWDGTEEKYRGSTLTLSNITGAQNVVVSFTEKDSSEINHQISTSVVNEGGQSDASLATITAVNTETNENISFENGETSVVDGTSLTFTANVTNSSNNMVKEWQVSTKDGSYTTIEGSGGQKSITIYNITKDMDVRAVVTQAQSYTLTYEIVGQNGTSVPADVATLTAVSNGQTLESGQQYSAFIPVDFSLKLSENYYVTEWSKNVSVNPEDNLNASLDSLTGDTVVTVTIAKKPTLTIDEPENGTITVTIPAEENGENVTLHDGDSFEQGTDLNITFTPAKGYVVSETKVNGDAINATYTDGNGSTTDTKMFTIENAQSDQTISATFDALQAYKITYNTVVVSGVNANGTVTASAERKGMAYYQIDSLPSEQEVYKGSNVTFTATPDDGYRVQEWRVNGEIYQPDGVLYTGNTLTLSDISKEQNVTVQFVQLGNQMTISAGANGMIEKVMVGNLDQTENIASGFTLMPNASVEITASPAAGYEVEKWVVNGAEVKVDDGEELYRGDVYTYTANAESSGAHVDVYFRPVTYNVSWGGTGGTVTAAIADEILDSDTDEIRGETEVTFTAHPDEGMKLSHWTVNGTVVESSEGAGNTTFMWTVPNGMQETPPVTEYNIQAVFTESPYTVTFNEPDNGTLSAFVNGQSISSGAEVDGNTEVTFTVTPGEGQVVGSWVVTKGDKEENVSTDQENPNTLTLSITADTHVTANMVPDRYTVSVSTTGNGTVTVNGEKEESYSAPYGSNMTFTAQPGNNYWQVDRWIVYDGKNTDITNTVNGTVSEDKTTFTLPNITQNMRVECVFVNQVGYELSYSVEGTNGTLSATANGNEITLDGNTTTVPGGSELKFTAEPEAGYMVAYWTVTVNGKEISVDNYSKIYTIAEMSGKTDVKVAFTNYVGYDIPANGEGYTITEPSRTPGDTEPDTKIRQNGDLTFTVSPATGYNTLGTLIINGYDCIADKLTTDHTKPDGCEKVTVIANDDGSYTVTIENVTAEISLKAKAHNLTHVDAKTPTCTEEGNIEYWCCSDENCDNESNLFADAKGTTPLQQGAEILGKDTDNGHTFGEPVFQWDGTSSAKAVFTCNICEGEETNGKKEVNCTVNTSENDAQITYTATAAFMGKTYTDTKTHKHTYGEPVFTWNGTSSVTAAFTCTQCDKVHTVNGTVNKTENDAQITYTATAAFMGKMYTDIKTHKHTYGEPVFTWNGTSSAQAAFTCSSCKETKTITCSIKMTEDADRTTWTASAAFNGQTYTSVKTQDKTIENYEFRLKGTTTKKSVKLTWTKVPAVDGYDIYWAKCEKKMKKVKTITSANHTKWTDKKKKLNSNHKYYVRAFKIVDGQKQYVNTSNTIHLAMPSKCTNVKTVKVSKKNLVLKKKKLQKLSVKTILISKNKRLVPHMNVLSFVSSDRRVASVNAKGIIKAKSKGSCYIYITAASGAYTKVRVTVR